LGAWSLIESFLLGSGGFSSGLSLEEIDAARADGAALWVNLASATEEEIEEILRARFGLPEGLVEECRRPSRLARLDDDGRVLFLVVPSPKKTVPIRAEFFMRQICLFISGQTIISCHREYLKAVQRLRDEILRDEGALLGEGPGRVLHHILGTIVGRYRQLAEGIESRAAQLGRGGLRGLSVELEEAVDLRRSVRALARAAETLRASILGLGAVAERLPPLAEQGLLGDLEEGLRTVLDRLALAEDDLSGAIELAGLRDLGALRLWARRGSVAAWLLVCILAAGLWRFALPGTSAAEVIALAAAGCGVALAFLLRRPS